MSFEIRNYRTADKLDLNRVAGDAFAEYRDHLEDWSVIHEEWGRMSDLSRQGQIVVAVDGESIVGGVCYIDADRPRPPWSETGWAVIRSLVVDPKYRGNEIGTRLTQVCIDRAVQDGCGAIALQTTPIMAQAIRIYKRLGFTRTKDMGIIHGVQWFVYSKEL
ncbi:MAG: GNAT family N-acetyltransferase [Planctomycetota bacterium]|nr:MAG: GNAT family N-acetyltransferase [Planctomycetota bacterium]